MKIAIHKGEEDFSESWIQYCQENNIPYKVVNCYDTNIISQVRDCDGLLWNWRHVNKKALLFARQLIYSLECMGLKVFPESSTCWHYDDKVGQKYLLESIRAPLVPAYVFYHKEEALKWMESTTFPKVFKLRNGAGSSNVYLIKNKEAARKKINKAFGKGYRPWDKWSYWRESLWKFRRDKNMKSLGRIIKYTVNLIFPSPLFKQPNPERGYVYFQDFIDSGNNEFRIVASPNLAFGHQRWSRVNKFGASGSNIFDRNHKLIPPIIIKNSFDIIRQLNLQVCAFDWIKDNSTGTFKLLEISYAYYSSSKYVKGYWDSSLNWHQLQIAHENLSLIQLIDALKKEKGNA
jgi:hypothetical protein